MLSWIAKFSVFMRRAIGYELSKDESLLTYGMNFSAYTVTLLLDYTNPKKYILRMGVYEGFSYMIARLCESLNLATVRFYCELSRCKYLSSCVSITMQMKVQLSLY